MSVIIRLTVGVFMPIASLDLTGKWEFKEYPLTARKSSDLDIGAWLPTNVPSSIFTSLITAEKIKLSDIHSNPENYQWVSEKPWLYRKKFDASDQLLACDKIKLIFEGLDTISTIWLNDKLIGRTNNMFIPFEFDITKIIKSKDNVLMVKFDPPVAHANKLMDKYPVPNNCDIDNPCRVYIRKAQYQFGWDICPALPGCGIWRPLRIEGITKAAFQDIHIRTVDCNPNHADIKITVRLETTAKEKFHCNLNISHPGQSITQKLLFKAGDHTHSTVIRIEKPALWWPRDYGPQNLYLLNVELFCDNNLIDQSNKTFGIRTVNLDRSADEYGENFSFEINGQPVYAKGANWIPPSIFAGSATDEDYQKLLQAASDANINMLRIWGGGYYENCEFYGICDKLGIMVWQDFMFARARYPEHDWFTQQVKEEAPKIIKQLRNHPSLVLWCGNSEIEWLHSKSKPGKNKKLYGKSIFHKILPSLLSTLDPDCNYIPTTPVGPAKKINNPNFGNIHQWDIWTNYKPISDYLCTLENIPRFVTEFGLQSIPNIKTLKNTCDEKSLSLCSQAIEKHNYQQQGPSRIYRYIGELFGLTDGTEKFIYLSQLTQARAAKKYIEHLRSHRYKNNGALFWQFNDCCPAISWSAIDFCGFPKALYYYSRRFFAKYLAAIVPDIDNKHFWPSKPTNAIVINDSSATLTATLTCRMINLLGATLYETSFPVVVTPFSNSHFLKLPKEIVEPPEPANAALHLLLENNNETIAENLFFYLPDKYIDPPKSQITCDKTRLTDSQWRICLKSNTLIKDLQVITSEPAILSDNFINLIPPYKKDIVINFKKQVLTDKFAIKLQTISNSASL